MLEQSMIDAVNRYTQAIKETEIYKNYYNRLAVLKQNPETLAKVNEFRQRNYELQRNYRQDELLQKLEAFEKEYEDLMENPIVDDFLQAELAFCRMMQDVENLVTEKLDFE
ncbi:MAG: YlbF family regulator [Lachnospiraceae bacterium]|nr:YlbF family regulator [Lachnospiraceae bacterium]